MSKNEWKKWVAVVGRMLLAYALVFAQGAWAGQNQGNKDKAGSPQTAAAQQATEKQPAAATTPVAKSKQAQGEESESAAEEKPSGDASHQGIKVHGHWTIEVRNLDGTLVTHREFENALHSDGALMLAGVLTRSASVGAWRIDLYGTDVANWPCISNGSPYPCSILEGSVQSPPIFSGLSVKLGTGGTIILAGAATAGANGNISQVLTSFLPCHSGYTGDPGLCPPTLLLGQAANFITQATAGPSNPSFTSPIPVQVNQTIGVTVVISFS